jgi:hypothetical protein
MEIVSSNFLTHFLQNYIFYKRLAELFVEVIRIQCYDRDFLQIFGERNVISVASTLKLYSIKNSNMKNSGRKVNILREKNVQYFTPSYQLQVFWNGCKNDLYSSISPATIEDTFLSLILGQNFTLKLLPKFYSINIYGQSFAI